MSSQGRASSSRWIPLGIGLCACVGLTVGSLALGTAEGAPTTESRPKTEAVQVVMNEIPLVCPPGIIDPEDVAPLRTSSATDAKPDAEAALATWAPGHATALTGGGELHLLGSEASSGDVTGLSLAGRESGDLLSLAIESCAIPGQYLAFAAGSTTVGEDTVLVLANPGDMPLSVQAQVYSEVGALLETPATLTIPAGSTLSVLPGSWVEAEENPVITLTAEGLGVAAWLQTSGLNGEVAQGLARIQGARPAETVVIPGVTASRQSTLRVGNLGAESTRVSVRLLGSDGEELLSGADGIPVLTQSTVSIDLAALPSDVNAIVVEADQPLVAAVTEVTEGGDHPDVRDAKYSSRTVVGGARQVMRTGLVDKSEVIAAAESLGFTNVEVAVALANPTDESIEVELQGAAKTLSPHSSQLYPLIGSLNDAELVASSAVYASYVVTASTPAGVVRSVTSLGTEGVLAQSRLVSLFPAN